MSLHVPCTQDELPELVDPLVTLGQASCSSGPGCDGTTAVTRKCSLGKNISTLARASSAMKFGVSDM